MKFTERQIRDFWAKVDRSNAGGCHLWTGAKSHRGYGLKNNLCEDGQKRLIHAHRMAWLITNGPIPDGLFVCHRCDVRLCCNAKEHLFLGTAQENTLDMIQKGRHVTPPKIALRFTADDGQRMAELSARGLSYRAIAKAFKTTHGMVRRVIQGEGGYAPEIN